MTAQEGYRRQTGQQADEDKQELGKRDGRYQSRQPADECQTDEHYQRESDDQEFPVPAMDKLFHHWPP